MSTSSRLTTRMDNVFGKEATNIRFISFSGLVKLIDNEIISELNNSF